MKRPIRTTLGIYNEVVSYIDGCETEDVQIREQEHFVEIGITGRVLDDADITVSDVEAAIAPRCPVGLRVEFYRMADFRSE